MTDMRSLLFIVTIGLSGCTGTNYRELSPSDGGGANGAPRRLKCDSIVEYQNTGFSIEADQIGDRKLTQPTVRLGRQSIRDAQPVVERFAISTKRLCDAVNGALRNASLWEEKYNQYFESLLVLQSFFKTLSDIENGTTGLEVECRYEIQGCNSPKVWRPPTQTFSPHGLGLRVVSEPADWGCAPSIMWNFQAWAGFSYSDSGQLIFEFATVNMDAPGSPEEGRDTKNIGPWATVDVCPGTEGQERVSKLIHPSSAQNKGTTTCRLKKSNNNTCQYLR